MKSLGPSLGGLRPGSARPGSARPGSARTDSICRQPKALNSWRSLKVNTSQPIFQKWEQRAHKSNRAEKLVKHFIALDLLVSPKKSPLFRLGIIMHPLIFVCFWNSKSKWIMRNYNKGVMISPLKDSFRSGFLARFRLWRTFHWRQWITAMHWCRAHLHWTFLLVSQFLSQHVPGSCHKRQKPQAPTPQAPIRNRQTRKVANAKVLNRNTNLT